MNTKPYLFANLFFMAALLVFAFVSPDKFEGFLNQSEFYTHIKFIHILSVSLFFANTVIGTLWETRALLSKNAPIIQYTYRTVVWFDAVFTAPLIVCALLSGIALATILGGVWTMGWLGLSFVLFLSTGLIWVTFDIPTQYRIKKQFKEIEIDAPEIPAPLRRLLWIRMGINFAGMIPLLAVFFLMVHKPAFPKLEAWFKAQDLREKLSASHLIERRNN